MITAYKEASTNRRQADKIHRQIQEIKADADKYHQEYITTIKEKREISNQLRKIRKEEREVEKVRDKERKDVQAESAIEKTKEGKKISFDEFKTLIDRGMI